MPPKSQAASCAGPSSVCARGRVFFLRAPQEVEPEAPEGDASATDGGVEGEAGAAGAEARRAANTTASASTKRD